MNNRRDFLAGLGTGAAALAATSVPPKASQMGPTSEPIVNVWLTEADGGSRIARVVVSKAVPGTEIELDGRKFVVDCSVSTDVQKMLDEVLEEKVPAELLEL